MQDATLRRILSALIDDFGYREVHDLLEACKAETAQGGARRRSSTRRHNKTRVKPDARTIVEALEIDDDQKRSVLMVLADEYEQKTFMPNMNNVRAFLVQQRKDASHIKSRQQAVSPVFRCLAEWSTENLKDLRRRGVYGRAKTLAVIASSIEAAGQQSRI